MENKKTKNVLLAIMGVLIVAEIVICIVIAQSNVLVIDILMRLVSLLFTTLYGFWLYKKPHGNMLKCAMLIFAIVSILASSKTLMTGKSYHIVKLLASAAVCYCAGRLNRIDQNKYLMPIIGVAFLAVSFYGVYLSIVNNYATAVIIASCFIFTINYFTLMIAYFVRYDEHKEAGLIDASKN